MLKRILCLLLILAAIEAPAQTSRLRLTAPLNGSTVNSNQRMLFTWLPPLPVGSDQIHKFKIVEILGDQSPEQAFRGNKPIFEKDSLIYFRTNKPHFEKDSLKELTLNARLGAGKRFAWSIQVFNRDGKLIGGNGESDIFTFRTANGEVPVKLDGVQRKQN